MKIHFGLYPIIINYWKVRTVCGIIGFWRNSFDRRTDWLEDTALKMANTLVHRGPDDKGMWVDP